MDKNLPNGSDQRVSIKTRLQKLLSNICKRTNFLSAFVHFLTGHFHAKCDNYSMKQGKIRSEFGLTQRQTLQLATIMLTVCFLFLLLSLFPGCLGHFVFFFRLCCLILRPLFYDLGYKIVPNVGDASCV
jgi:hypothetical protein